jgi:hypothetical protein
MVTEEPIFTDFTQGQIKEFIAGNPGVALLVENGRSGIHSAHSDQNSVVWMQIEGTVYWMWSSATGNREKRENAVRNTMKRIEASLIALSA